jgi:2-haloacid dehalogenase
VTTAVIFDVANVIVDWDPIRALEGVVDDERVEAFLASEAFWEVNARTDAGMPLRDGLVELDDQAPHLADVYRVYLERFPLTVSGPVPGTAEVIGELLAAGVRCYGLSNWAKETFNVARRASPVIDRLDDVIVSGEVGLAKPDPEIFRYALERFGLEAGSTLMIDDTQLNLDSASTVGMGTVLFTGADDLRAELRARQLL